MSNAETVPNHHAHHAPFTGPLGVLAALSMIRGRDDEARLAVELSGLRADETVVDVGCGPGAAVRLAASKGANVIGVDPAPVMRRTAKLLTRRRVSFRDGAAERLPVDDAGADVVWSIATVHHWQDLDAGLREVRRVLVPGGRFVAIEHLSAPGARGLGSHGWTPEQAAAFAACCTAHGFENVRVQQHRAGRRDSMSVTATSPLSR